MPKLVKMEHFIKISSYEGTQSTGHVKISNMNEEELRGQHVLVIEDIYDTGHTICALKK